jgi:hypothetical protein
MKSWRMIDMDYSKLSFTEIVELVVDGLEKCSEKNRQYLFDEYNKVKNMVDFRCKKLSARKIK